jgi:hypothetical protein
VITKNARMLMKRTKAAASIVVVVAAVTMIACGSSSRGLSFFFTSRSGHGVELLEAEAAASPGHGLSLHLHSGSERSAAAQGRRGRDAMLGGKVGAMTESLSMSASARHKLSRAVAKAGRAPTESERRDMTADLDRIAGLLATQEVAFPSQPRIPTKIHPPCVHISPSGASSLAPRSQWHEAQP